MGFPTEIRLLSWRVGTPEAPCHKRVADAVGDAHQREPLSPPGMRRGRPRKESIRGTRPRVEGRGAVDMASQVHGSAETGASTQD